MSSTELSANEVSFFYALIAPSVPPLAAEEKMLHKSETNSIICTPQMSTSSILNWRWSLYGMGWDWDISYSANDKSLSEYPRVFLNGLPYNFIYFCFPTTLVMACEMAFLLFMKLLFQSFSQKERKVWWSRLRGGDEAMQQLYLKCLRIYHIFVIAFSRKNPIFSCQPCYYYERIYEISYYSHTPLSLSLSLWLV